MKHIYTIIALLVLAACSSGQQQSSIAALEVGLATAETAATSYKNLPPCVTLGSGVCSDIGVVAQLKAADNLAYTAIKSAEKTAASGASVDLTAATAALTAFQGLVATYVKKGN